MAIDKKIRQIIEETDLPPKELAEMYGLQPHQVSMIKHRHKLRTQKVSRLTNEFREIRPFSAEEIEYVRTTHEPISVICKKLGRSKSSVYNLYHRLFNPTNAPNAAEIKHRADFIKEHAADMSTNAIASALGIKVMLVRRAMRDMGLMPQKSEENYDICNGRPESCEDCPFDDCRLNTLQITKKEAEWLKAGYYSQTYLDSAYTKRRRKYGGYYTKSGESEE